jgi:exodeoxyribonuclease VIII
MKIIHDLPSDAYHAMPDLSNSGMSKLKKTPANFKHYLDQGSESSDAMEFGSMFHMFILEPDKFARTYECTGINDRRTTAYKAAAKKIEEAGKIPIDAKTADVATGLLSGMKNAMMQSYPGFIPLRDGRPEVSVLYEDDGVQCKCRIDYLGDDAIIDLKTTTDASANGFQDSVFKFGYNRQQAHYQRPFELAGTPKRFYFWAVEKEPPFLNAIYELDEAALIMGRAEREKLMALYKTCKALDKWPGLPTNIQTISLPAWAFRDKSDNQ